MHRKLVTDGQSPCLQDLWGRWLRLQELGAGFPEVKKDGKEEKEVYQFPSDKKISLTLS